MPLYCMLEIFNKWGVYAVRLGQSRFAIRSLRSSRTETRMKSTIVIKLLVRNRATRVKDRESFPAVVKIPFPLPSGFAYWISKPLDEILKRVDTFIRLPDIEDPLDAVLAITVNWRRIEVITAYIHHVTVRLRSAVSSGVNG